jgi:hypothetical protein
MITTRRNCVQRLINECLNTDSKINCRIESLPAIVVRRTTSLPRSVSNQAAPVYLDNSTLFFMRWNLTSPGNGSRALRFPMFGTQQKRPGQTSPVFDFPMDLMVWNHIPQQGAWAGAQQVGAAGAQQGSGAGQQGSQLWRRKHFLNIPENKPQRGLLHGSQHGSGSQHTGAGAQHVGVCTQQGSGCGQHGSQQDDLGLKQPKRPASAD